MMQSDNGCDNGNIVCLGTHRRGPHPKIGRARGNFSEAAVSHI